MQADISGQKEKIIIVAGATGKLGRLIVEDLLERGAKVRALVRRGGATENTSLLAAKGAEVMPVNYADIQSLTKACAGGFCVVSALSGLREVIIEMQENLLEATVKAGVPRFIPSDYCIDYTKLSPGHNRNLDLRREFAARLYRAPVQATSILNGMFTDLLNKEAPLIQKGFKKVIYWGNKRQMMDFTTMADTATFTALAALDPGTPRYLRIAGEVASAEGISNAASDAFGKDFTIYRVGGLGLLETFIKITKTLFPQPKEVFPAWQGMQYMRDMFTGLPKLHHLDNQRYPEIRWTPIRDVLKNSE